jgi:hypothetical protein
MGRPLLLACRRASFRELSIGPTTNLLPQLNQATPRHQTFQNP